MRRLSGFDCEGHWCAATLDAGEHSTGLFIVSGGNEIRSGAHAGQARLSDAIAKAGYPVFRYDRRGTGESEGENSGFEGAAADLAAALVAFRAQQPHLKRVVAFGNCDAASLLALHHHGRAIDLLVLANPWVIENDSSDGATVPPATAIRVRYMARLRDPRSLIDLFAGRINLAKLWRGLRRAVQPANPTALAGRIADSLCASDVPVKILLASKDMTACAFAEAWSGHAFADVRYRSNVVLRRIDSASHSFAGIDDARWLRDQLLEVLADPA